MDNKTIILVTIFNIMPLFILAKGDQDALEPFLRYMTVKFKEQGFTSEEINNAYNSIRNDMIELNNVWKGIV